MRMRITLLVAAALVLAAASGLAAESGAPAFVPPKIITTVQPAYPQNTVSSGTVVLDVTVAASGEIQNVKVVQGAAGFTDEALRTVRKWQFAPATLDGKPVASDIPVVFSFSQPTVWWNDKQK